MPVVHLNGVNSSKVRSLQLDGTDAPDDPVFVPTIPPVNFPRYSIGSRLESQRSLFLEVSVSSRCQSDSFEEGEDWSRPFSPSCYCMPPSDVDSDSDSIDGGNECRFCLLNQSDSFSVEEMSECSSEDTYGLQPNQQWWLEIPLDKDSALSTPISVCETVERLTPAREVSRLSRGSIALGLSRLASCAHREQLGEVLKGLVLNGRCEHTPEKVEAWDGCLRQEDVMTRTPTLNFKDLDLWCMSMVGDEPLDDPIGFEDEVWRSKLMIALLGDEQEVLGSKSDFSTRSTGSPNLRNQQVQALTCEGDEGGRGEVDSMQFQLSHLVEALSLPDLVKAEEDNSEIRQLVEQSATAQSGLALLDKLLDVREQGCLGVPWMSQKLNDEIGQLVEQSATAQSGLALLDQLLDVREQGGLGVSWMSQELNDEIGQLVDQSATAQSGLGLLDQLLEVREQSCLGVSWMSGKQLQLPTLGDANLLRIQHQSPSLGEATYSASLYSTGRLQHQPPTLGDANLMRMQDKSKLLNAIDVWGPDRRASEFATNHHSSIIPLNPIRSVSTPVVDTQSVSLGPAIRSLAM
eukprot:gene6887-30862_t